MADGLRKSTALLSVLLVLTAFRCMATCLVNDTETSAHSSSTTAPPCHQHGGHQHGGHQHHGQEQGTPNSVPCQSHPGLLAYSVHQPSAYVDVTVNLLAAVFEPAPILRESRDPGAGNFAHIPPLPRSEALSSIILRI